MNWKNFLKPNWVKVLILGLILFVISSFFNPLYPLSRGLYEGEIYYVGTKLGFYYYGFPLFYFTFVPEKSEGVLFDFCDLPPCPPRGLSIESYPNLFINLIFWIVVSSLIVWIYNKVKKK